MSGDRSLVRAAMASAALLWTLASSAQAGGAANEQEVEQRGRQALARFDRPGAPGCAVGAFRDGRAIFKHAFGLADLERRSHNTARSAFGVASVSKQFTAALAAIAAHEGYLSLQDDVRKHLPELPDYGARITVEHLIHHTSGLRDDWTLIRISGHDLASREEIIRLVARQRALNFAPGSRFLYSNAGYVLLAEIVERATRRQLREYARRKIFEPLAMRDSYYRDRSSQDKRLVTAYVPEGSGWRQKDMPETAARIGTQGVVTTLADYSKWASNLFAERSRLPGGTALTRRLLTVARLSDGSDAPYAFGLRPQRYRGFQVWSHAGSGWGFKAEAMMFPELRLTVAAFCNNGRYAAPVALAIADVLLPAVSESRVESSDPTIAEAELAPLAGMYREGSLGLPMIVTPEPGGLRVSGDAVDMRFHPVTLTKFRAEGNAELEFERFAQAPASRFYQRGSTPYGTGIFERVEAARPTGDQLAAYAGRYFSSELQATYLVDVNGGELTARVPDADEELAVTYSFTPTIVDEFADLSEAVLLRFGRDSRGAVRGFVLNAQFGRVQGVAFERLPE